MSFQPTVIYSAANPQQAHLLVSLLEERGIAARTTNDLLQVAGGELPLGWSSAAKVLVDEADAPAAREFALEFDKRTRTTDTTPDPVAEPDDESWSDWPLCSQCGARQQTECTYCGSAGTDFRLADIDEQSQRVLLACSDCDDLFQPKFYRLCARCGHDFGSGIAIAGGETSDDSRRMWAVLIGIGIFGAAMCGYFYWLMR